MSKGARIISTVLGSFLIITYLHVWLNIGLDKLGLAGTDKKQAAFKVGFLPVT